MREPEMQKEVPLHARMASGLLPLVRGYRKAPPAPREDHKGPPAPEGIRMNRPAAVGALLLSKGFAAEAIPFLKKGARINDLAPLVNLGAAYRWTNQFVEAETILWKAAKVHPKSPEVWGNLSMLYEDKGDFPNSHRINMLALELAPDNPQINLNAAYSYLRRGDWMKGWSLFERRPVDAGSLPNLPRWTGKESLQDRRLLIVPEGGFGDAIYFARWFDHLAELRPESVTLVMWDSMVSLFQPARMRQLKVVPESEGVNLLDGNKLAFDYFIPLMSLAACCGATAKNIPFCDQAYMEVEPEAFPEGYLRVGVCLQAEENRTQRPHRSVPPALWRSLVKKDENIRWYNFQKNLAVNDYTTTPVFAGGINPDGDWLQTAKLVAGLDLVITVDSAVAHVSGALGKETWLLVPKRRDWKWSHKPYPNMRYFQQDELVDWRPTLRRVRKALKEKTR